MTGSDLSFHRITLAAAEKGGNGESRLLVTTQARGGGGLEDVGGQSLDLLKREPGGFADSSEGMREDGVKSD